MTDLLETLRSIRGTLEAVSDRDWDGKWRVKKAIAIADEYLDKHTYTPAMTHADETLASIEQRYKHRDHMVIGNIILQLRGGIAYHDGNPCEGKYGNLVFKNGTVISVEPTQNTAHEPKCEPRITKSRSFLLTRTCNICYPPKTSVD